MYMTLPIKPYPPILLWIFLLILTFKRQVSHTMSRTSDVHFIPKPPNVTNNLMEAMGIDDSTVFKRFKVRPNHFYIYSDSCMSYRVVLITEKLTERGEGVARYE